MNKVILGYTGVTISCIGLGTMYFGSKTNEEASFQLLDKYVGSGGSFLDTANKYASWIPGFEGGESERLLGRWMKQRGNRQRVFLSSKVGFAYGSVPRSLKKEIIISECERSLRRLGVETIDLYFAHAYDDETPIDETMEAFYKLREDGKIRFAGASNFYAWQLGEANSAAKLMDWEGFSCVQQRHTYLEPALRADFGNQLILTPELEEFCLRKKVSIMAYSPLLEGAYVRNDRPIPVQYRSGASEDNMKVLKEVAEEFAVSPNAIVLAWMMQSFPSVIPLITGSSVKQLDENLEALSVKLTKEQLERLNHKKNQQNNY